MKLLMISTWVYNRGAPVAPGFTAWWHEGEDTVNMLQHENGWIHPQYSFSMFLDLFFIAVARHGHRPVAYYWDEMTLQWIELDFYSDFN